MNDAGSRTGDCGDGGVKWRSSSISVGLAAGKLEVAAFGLAARTSASFGFLLA